MLPRDFADARVVDLNASVERVEMSMTESRPGLCESLFKSSCVTRPSPTRFEHCGSHMLRAGFRLNPSHMRPVSFRLTRQEFLKGPKSSWAPILEANANTLGVVLGKPFLQFDGAVFEVH